MQLSPYFIRYFTYFILFILGISIYLLLTYKINRIKKNKITRIKDLFIIVTGISYFYILFSPRAKFIYHMTYMKAILLFISITVLLFSVGLLENKEKTYKKNISLYIVLYIILLISITMVIGRMDVNFNIKNLQYLNTQSLIPFRSIKSYMSSNVLLRTQLYNLLGNCVMFIPLSFLLMLKYKKKDKLFHQIKIIFPCVLIIEFLQLLTNIGSFDIDDVILNIFGSLCFTFIITRFHLMDKIRKLFYNDLHIKESLKYVLFYLALVIPSFFILNTIYLTIQFMF